MNRRGRPGLLRELNASALLELIREHGRVSRPELAELSGLSLPTVNARTRSLLESGYILESGTAKSNGGRPAQLLEFNGEFGYVVGVDVGGFRVSVALSDLAGNTIALEQKPLEEHVHGDGVMEVAQTILRQLLVGQGLKFEDLMSAGLSTPGLVDPTTKEVSFVPNIPGWSQLKPVDRLEELIGKPVEVENDVNAAIKGEAWRGAARGVRNAVFVSVGRGVGAGILVKGEIYRGSGGAAGEIGLQREFHNDEPLDGLFGPFERHASALGMVRRYRELTAEQDGTIGARDIFLAATGGDESAQRVLQETISMLAGGLVNLCAVLAPELLILGGDMACAGGVLAEPVRRRLGRTLPNPPQVVVSELKDRASVLGATRLALEAADERIFAVETGRRAG